MLRLACTSLGLALCEQPGTTTNLPFTAATDFAFNAGASTYCESTIARSFAAGDLATGCRAFLALNKATVSPKS